MKYCYVCQQFRPLLDFTKNRTTKDGLQYECKACTRKYKSQYEKSHPEISKNRKLKYNFGITLTEYNELLTKQNGVCRICQKAEYFLKKKSANPRDLAVDHCHKTGKIRGLLCATCNLLLGKLNDDVEFITKFITYLKEA